MTPSLPSLLRDQPLAPALRPEDHLARTLETGDPDRIEPLTRLDVFHGYMGVFVAAFIVTLLATPFLRRLAVAHGVVDRPLDPRKQHRVPVAYLGGVAVFMGLLAGVAYSYVADATSLALIERHALSQRPVPFAILLGMMLIMLAGLLDDVVGVRPRIKVSLQLVAAAALAMNDVGVKVASGVLTPIGRLIGNESLLFTLTVDVPQWMQGAGMGGPTLDIQLDVVYWVGTAIIAVFILGACNASNLLDGLDGLCTGVTAIAAAGLLFIALTLAVANDGPLDFARIVLCLGLLGACLGFLPHNFNPATIFLGDAGSLQLGYVSIVIILSLGDTGKTGLVVAGLLIYLVPIIDTTLAIVRRRMAGKPMSAADDQHLHHQLKRALGVRGAVFVLYGIAGIFCVLGAAVSEGRARVAFAIALVIASFIGVTAVKIARRQAIEQEMLDAELARASAIAAGEPKTRRVRAVVPPPPSPPAPRSPEPAGANPA